MSVTKKLYGTMPDGTNIYAYTLDNGKGLMAEVLNYGGIITKLLVNDKNGTPTDVVLGRASLEEYLANDGYIGAAIGRNAGRIANGDLMLNGVAYKLNLNRDGNNLHGGFCGFDKKIWNVEEKENALVLKYTSVDGEENFPGNLDVTMTYTLTDDNALKIEYDAVSDKDTLCNLTNHSYFNVGGHESGTIYEQMLYMNVDEYITESTVKNIKSVDGTPFDFRTPKPIGRDMDMDYPDIKAVGGYDHHFVINSKNKGPAIWVESPVSGIRMEVYTNQPVVIFYSGNNLSKGVHKGEREYQSHEALCLETGAFPTQDENFGPGGEVLKKGERYNHVVEYKFSN